MKPETFWKKVQKAENGCWLWLGQKKKGYGRIRLKRENRMIQAHRYAYVLAYGFIPAGKCVCHKCDAPACVRPDHLFLGSHWDNMHDSVIKGRKSWGKRRPGSDSLGAKLWKLRIAKGFSQKQLAEACGLHGVYICRIETGNIKRPRPETIHRLVQGLGACSADLIE
ncbi:MAG: helix-turn-helix domain-containing protein [Gammaproteobacteria bacterium]